MEDKEVENIINKTLDERKKRNISKIFHDPAKAETAFIWAFLGGLILGIGLFILINGTAPIPDFNDSSIELFQKLDCQSLKELIIDERFSRYTITLQNLILSKCL